MRDAERTAYENVLAGNAAELAAQVQPGDIVLLHDPQTAGLVATMLDRGAITIWRSHIGVDTSNEHTDTAWAVPAALRGTGACLCLLAPGVRAGVAGW